MQILRKYQSDIFEAKERMFGLGDEFKYAECLNCGSLQLNQIPEDLSSCYSNADYYSLGKLVESGLKIRILKAIPMRAFLLTGNSQIAPIYGCWLKKNSSGLWCQNSRCWLWKRTVAL